MTQSEEYEPWVTTKTIMRLFSISHSTLHRMVHGNPPLPHKRIGKVFRFRVSEVERFFDEHGENIQHFSAKYPQKRVERPSSP